MRVLLIAAVAAVAVAMAGCAPPRKPVTVDVNVTEGQLSPFRAVGDAAVTGQAFLRQQGGGVVTCAGEPVFLAPDLPPVRQAVELAKAGYDVDSALSDHGSLKGAGREATCDAQGNFSFKELPAASWYVVTRVRWMVAGEQQGSDLAHPVQSLQGEEVRILLTDDDRIPYQ